MAEMSFTEARIALDQFVKAYRAANMLGQAMEAVANMERRTAEVKNNLEHLLKEQDIQQKNLDAMAKETEEQYKSAVKQHKDAVAKMQQERDTAAAQARSERDAFAKATADENDRMNALVKGHNDKMESLTAERVALEKAITVLTAQAEEIKAKMRVFVS